MEKPPRAREKALGALAFSAVEVFEVPFLRRDLT